MMKITDLRESARETVKTVKIACECRTTSLTRGVIETLNLQGSTLNFSNLLTPQRMLGLLTRFWRWTVELAEITKLNLQQKN
jgi:hypothetical protein